MKIYLTNALEDYDCYYVTTLRVLPNQPRPSDYLGDESHQVEIKQHYRGQWRLIAVSDMYRFTAYQVPRYQSGLFQAYEQDSPEYAAVMKTLRVTDEWLREATTIQYRRYSLKIALGNDGTQTREQLANIIRKAAYVLETQQPQRFGGVDEGCISDENGNQVATWHLL